MTSPGFPRPRLSNSVEVAPGIPWVDEDRVVKATNICIQPSGLRMGYSYALCKTIDESIDDFGKVTEQTITWWDYSLDDIHRAVDRIVPEIKWDSVKEQESAINFWSSYPKITQEQKTETIASIKSRDPSTSGQVIHPDWGKFECRIDMQYGFLFVETSFHCDYRHFVIAFAKALHLSAFDAQTGERIYNPFNDTETPGTGRPPGLPEAFREFLSKNKG